jgi:carbamoyltransferase
MKPIRARIILSVPPPKLRQAEGLERNFSVNILGINAYHANASAALVCEGRLVAAAEEERFNRVKYAAGFPAAAIRYCLKAGGLTLADLDHIAIPRNPFSRVGTKFLYSLRMPRFARERAKAWVSFADIPETLAQVFEADPNRIRARVHRVEHHRAHLASAFFVSPFDRAALLSADGMGDFASTMWATGEGSRIRIHGSTAFPHSLGIYYTALSQYLGFWNFGDEYKVMGLAAHGQPVYLEEIRRILRGHGTDFRLGLSYFNHSRHGAEMSWKDATKSPVLGRLFSDDLEVLLGPARLPDAPLEQKHKDIAASVQARLEEILFGQMGSLHARTGAKTVCLAGGVAFNCVANGKILGKAFFERVFVQPAAGDAGLALGAAFYVWNEILRQPRGFQMQHAFWGPGYSPREVRIAIEEKHLSDGGFDISELPEEQIIKETARHVSEGEVVGWFAGRAEWGPRALGNRSIIADPRRPEMKNILNLRTKRRESFRPFGPSILAESATDFFETHHPSPFMTFAYPLRQERRDALPAATHVDGTCRLQTVERYANPRYWALIIEFGRLTGIPAVINTSFNDSEPIVCAPQEAIDCFLRTDMDVLVMENYMVRRPRSADAKRAVEIAARRISEVSR